MLTHPLLDYRRAQDHHRVGDLCPELDGPVSLLGSPVLRGEARSRGLPLAPSGERGDLRVRVDPPALARPPRAVHRQQDGGGQEQGPGLHVAVLPAVSHSPLTPPSSSCPRSSGQTT